MKKRVISLCCIPLVSWLDLKAGLREDVLLNSSARSAARLSLNAQQFSYILAYNSAWCVKRKWVFQENWIYVCSLDLVYGSMFKYYLISIWTVCLYVNSNLTNKIYDYVSYDKCWYTFPWFHKSIFRYSFNFFSWLVMRVFSSS